MLDSTTTCLSEERGRTEWLEGALESKASALEEEELRSREFEEQLQRLGQEAEYSRCCAIPKEAQKWEAQEACLVRQLEELERRFQVQDALTTKEPTLFTVQPALCDESGDASTLSAITALRGNVESARGPALRL